jgi:hypothetical protein
LGGCKFRGEKIIGTIVESPKMAVRNIDSRISQNNIHGTIEITLFDRFFYNVFIKIENDFIEKFC